MASQNVLHRAVAALGLTFVLAFALVWRMSSTSLDERVSMEEASKLELPRVRSSFSPKSQRDDAQARYEYDLARLRDPLTGHIPDGIRARELAFVRNLPRADQLVTKRGGVLADDWMFLGPRNVGGRTRALAIDLGHNGTSNRRILAGGVSGGIYLSEDDGATWSRTTSLADLASVTSLAQDPSNHNVWYFGTGEFLGNSAGGGLQQYYGQGLFKSSDGGASWSRVQSTIEGSLNVFDNIWDFVWNIAVHPSGNVFAATYGGILRSSDGGDSWQYSNGRAQDSDPFSTITDVAIGADGTVYATLSRNGSGATNYGVFKSSDVGDQWQNISPPDLATDPYRIVVGAAPSDANTLYILVQSTQQGTNASHHQLFRTGDGGTTWTDLSGSIPNEEGIGGNASFSTQGGYDQMVAVKPDDANTVFIGGTNLYRSMDAGATFTRIGGYASAETYAQMENHHSDQHAMVFLPTDPNVAVSGHDGGLSRSLNILAEPHAWSSLNNGYVTTQFYTVAMDPQAGGPAVIGGMQDNGTWGTEETDAGSEWFSLFSGDGAHAAITPGATAFYVSSQAGTVYRLTQNAPAYVTPEGAQKFMFINPFVLDPNDARIMYMGEAGGVWRNSNLEGIPDGNKDPTPVNWTFLNSSARTGTSTSTIAVAKTPANRLYFGTTDYQSQSALVRVDNAQTNPVGIDITPPVSAEGFSPFPSGIAVNPQNGDEIIAVYSNYNTESLWHSANGGSTWTSIEGNLGGPDGPSLRTVAILPTGSTKMYLVGTSTGVYSTFSLDGAATTWALEGGDVLGNVVVDMLVVRPEDGTIVAATHGRGVYRATVEPGVSSAVATVTDTALEIEAAPGSIGSTTFTLTNSGTAELTYSAGALGKIGSSVSQHLLEPNRNLVRPSGSARTTDTRVGGPTPARRSATISNPSASPSTSGDFIVLDDGSDFPDDFLGWGDGATPFQWGSRFIAPAGGFSLESFYVYMRSEAEPDLPVSVYITDPEGNSFLSGALTLPASTNGNEGEWYRVTFDPIALPEGQAFDIELIVAESVLYPAGVDMNGQVPESGFYWIDSEDSYAALADQEGYANGAWLIRAEGTAGNPTSNQPPVADIQVSATQAVIHEDVSFDGTGSTDADGTVDSYSWTFGDGGSSTEPMPTHAFTTAGSYTVMLTVADNAGATDQATVSLNILSESSRLTVTPTGGTLAPGESQEITVNYDASAVTAGQYAGRVNLTTNGGNITIPVSIHVDGSVDAEPAQEIPQHLSLAQNYPNPFNPQTTVQFSLERSANVRLAIFDVNGRIVRVLFDGMQAPGTHQLTWDGQDAAGRAVASGTFFYRLETDPSGGESVAHVTRKMVLLR